MSTDTAKTDTAKQTKADQSKPDAPKAPRQLFVLDTTATVGSGARTHEQLIDGHPKAFTFEPGKPLSLDRAVAIKFLKHDAFKLVDDKGTPLEFKRRPKQPDELGAGEAIKLAQDETIARYEELSTPSLQARVLEMPGGERFADAPVRAEMIAFIIKAKQELAKANLSRESEVGRDEFVPDGALEDEAA